MNPSRLVAGSGLVLGRMREDPALEARVIAEVARQQTRPLRVGLVAAAGDTALSLLALEAVGAIEAIDENAAQLHLVELKRRAIAALPLPEQWVLLGVASGTPDRRLALYAGLAPMLPEGTRRHWDAHLEEVAFGLALAGSEDRRFARLQASLASRGLDPVLHPREALLDAGWRVAFEEVFGKRGAVLAEAFAQVLWRELPQENYLLMQAWREDYDPDRGLAPPAMLPEAQSAMQALGLGRLKLHQGVLVSTLEILAEEAPFDVVSLSTLTDDIPTATLPGLLDRLRRVLAPGGALLARRVHGERPIAPVFGEHLQVAPSLSQRLAMSDRAPETRECVVAFA
ncbi:MAG: DUF3419 family protein [Candidatus Sericytochromatia bacterium]